MCLSTELSGRIGTFTLLAILFVLVVLVCCGMGFIDTWFDLIKVAILMLLDVEVLLFIAVPIFPVCQILAKEQCCLCCTTFLNVRLILGPQGCGAGGRACL